jgi:deazaflavin-dependent oxidoreductase (nitroreductase family)
VCAALSFCHLCARAISRGATPSVRARAGKQQRCACARSTPQSCAIDAPLRRELRPIAGTRSPVEVISMSKPLSPIEQRAVTVVNRTFGSLHAWLYQKTDGKIGSTFTGGAPVMLLTTRGRKTGMPRTAPLLYLRDGERIIIVASRGGHPNHPAWYLNLKAHPEVEVQIGDEKRTMRAETASMAQKAKYWPRLIAVYPPFQDCQARTDRDIPVVVLKPA